MRLNNFGLCNMTDGYVISNGLYYDILFDFYFLETSSYSVQKCDLDDKSKQTKKKTD